jgi:hypothetical protein
MTAYSIKYKSKSKTAKIWKYTPARVITLAAALPEPEK